MQIFFRVADRHAEAWSNTIYKLQHARIRNHDPYIVCKKYIANPAILKSSFSFFDQELGRDVYIQYMSSRRRGRAALCNASALEKFACRHSPSLSLFSLSFCVCIYMYARASSI